WEFYTGTGYSIDPGQARPLDGVTSAGPLSFAAFRTMAVMSTVDTEGTDHLGQVWHSQQGRPFRKGGPPGALGDTPPHLGHGLQLQAQLETNTTTALMLGASGGVPYVVSTKAASGGNSALVNSWGLHTISV